MRHEKKKSQLKYSIKNPFTVYSTWFLVHTKHLVVLRATNTKLSWHSGLIIMKEKKHTYYTPARSDWNMCQYRKIFLMSSFNVWISFVMQARINSIFQCKQRIYMTHDPSYYLRCAICCAKQKLKLLCFTFIYTLLSLCQSLRYIFFSFWHYLS